MPYIRGQDRNQPVLFPENIDDHISSDNPIRVIDEYVEQLDMQELGFKFAVSPHKGRPPYRPKDLLKLYLYGGFNGVRSSRKLEKETHKNIEVMWLLGKLTPDFKTIADFRKDNKEALKKVYRDFNELCQEWGLYGREMVAIDSSKIKASNSKRNNYSKKKLKRQQKYIDEKIDKYLKDLEENDKAESAERKPTTEEIEKRLKQLRQRKKKYESYEQKLEEEGKNEISTTDPDARLMSSNNNGVDVAYNVQITVDAKHKLVPDFEVITDPNDLGQLDDMALRTKEIFGVDKLEVLADKGYYRTEDLKLCAENGITPYVSKQTYSNGTGEREFYPDRFKYEKEKDVYICPAGEELSYSRTRRDNKKQILGYNYKNFQACQRCSHIEKCTKSKRGRTIFRHVDQDFLDTIDVETGENKNKYQLRTLLVEHPFGTIKRFWNMYYFLTRGRSSVKAEAALSFMTYNLKRAINVLGVEEMIKRLKQRQRKPVLT